MNLTNSQTSGWVPFLLEQELGKYKPTVYRGGGEFGLVFAALDSESNNEVALKVLPPTSDAMRVLEFDDEGRILRRLEKSSHVVSSFESGQQQLLMSAAHSAIEVPVVIRYHALELAAGSLDELVENEELRNNLSWPEKLELWRDVVKGIHQMHLANCVHRDLKCSNILMFIERFNKTSCRLGDMGKARDLSVPARLSPAEYLVGRGDLRFAPPECIYMQGESNAVAFRCEDLYGLGSVFFEICTGQGITSIALGHGPRIFQESLNEHRLGRHTDLSGLKSHYNKAIAVLEPELPMPIRSRAVALVSKLCSPVPMERLPKFGLGQRRPSEPGLNWLFQQIDIMRKTLNVPRRINGRYRRGR